MTARGTSVRTQQERSETTQRQLVDAARECFAADGYAATLLDDVVRRAGVTKGALYHHFRGKRELFEAVFEREHQRLAEVAGEAYHRKRDHWEGMHAACRAHLEASLDPGVQRITLLDGPSILGWRRLRELEDRHGVAAMRHGLQLAIDEGIIEPRPVEPLVQMLFGALCEAAMYAARADDPRRATRDVLAEVRVMLDGLRRPS